VRSLIKLLREIGSLQWFKQTSYSISGFKNLGVSNFENRKLDMAYQIQHSEVFAETPNSNFTEAKAFITDANFSYSDTRAIEEAVALKPLRVMMLGLRGFPDVQGGVETHAEHLAPLLVKLGCDLEVVVRSPYQKADIGKQWCGVKFTRLWAPKSKGLEAVLHTFLGVLYAAIKRPDILHIHAVGPALMTPLARFFGLKVVITHHGPDYNRQKWGFLARNILLLGEWLGMRYSNGRIVISNVIRDLVLRKHTMHSELICNGVVMPELNVSDSYLEQFGLQKSKYILLVSRLVPEKRHLDLIKAFNSANLSGYKLVFVGSSDHPDEYVQSLIEAKNANPSIVLTGFQTGDTLRSLYTHAALFVLPSSHEGLSISLLEALSYGLPVVASNIPANLELGLNPVCYFELGKIDKLAELLKKNIYQPASVETRMDMREWVSSHYNWRRVAERTYQEYRSVYKYS
jgi:glycosyltransferase involved in cell wall biosynthesis